MLKLKAINIALVISKIFKSIGKRLEYWVKALKYGPNKGKVFDISVDDDIFQMSFSNFHLGFPIIERLEGIREPDTTAIIKSILKPGDNVLELGGCYGYFTMLMANAVTETGKVVSIEGHAEYFEILTKNIKRNSILNVMCYNKFIGTKGETVELTTESRIFSKTFDGVNQNNKILVNCINIKDFLDDIDFRPDYIFMDIEGFEVDVIEQLGQEILGDQASPTIIFEHHEHNYSDTKNLKYIRDLLEQFGYKTRKIYGNILAFKN
jgi:FkbM family methyltransferase